MFGGGLMKDGFSNVHKAPFIPCSLSNVLASPTLPWRGLRSFVTVPGTFLP